MAETGPLEWARPNARWLVPVAGVLFVVGIALGAHGVTAALGAGEDLDVARADLATAEDNRAEAAEGAEQATARLDEAQPAAAATLAATQAVAEDGRELCNCDEEQQTLARQGVEAILDEDGDEYNRVIEEINGWTDQHNALADQINENLPEVRRLAD
jgi:hypothetical protein